MKQRNMAEIRRCYSVLWDKVWWNRHMAAGQPVAGRSAAERIEKNYGRDLLEPGGAVEWGICQGKMMALAWMLGAEWEEAGDT